MQKKRKRNIDLNQEAFHTQEKTDLIQEKIKKNIKKDQIQEKEGVDQEKGQAIQKIDKKNILGRDHHLKRIRNKDQDQKINKKETSLDLI